MAPTRKFRTYNPSTSVNSSVDAVNFLFAKNMTRRLISKKKIRKKKLIVNELPNQIEPTVLTDNSLQVSIDDTFDKLRKGPVYNNVKHIKYIATDSKLDGSFPKNYPVSKKSSFNLSDFSPIVTRNRKKISNSLKNKSDSTQQLFKDSTIEILNSIEVEPDRIKKNSQSLSYIKIPTITFNYSKHSSKHISNLSHVNNSSKMEESFSRIFSKTYFDKQPIKCSTPLDPLKKKIVSPIRNLVPLIKQSFEEIEKWESEFPVIDERTKSVVITKNNDEKSKELSINDDFINLRKRRVFRSENFSEKNSIKSNHLSASLEKNNSSDKSTRLENSEQNTHGSFNLEEFESFTRHNYPHLKLRSDLTPKRPQCNSFQHFENTDVSYVNKRKHRMSLNSSHSEYFTSVKDCLSEGDLDKNEDLSSSKYKHSSLKNADSLCTLLNVPRHPCVEDFEKFYLEYMSQTNFSDNKSTTESEDSNGNEPQKDVVINLTNCSHIFEEFYQDHYTEMETETLPNSLEYAPFSCKDLVVNITKREDMFEKFYQEYYSEIKSETDRRKEPETDIIENVLMDLVINVTKNNFKEYMSFSNVSNNSTDEGLSLIKSRTVTKISIDPKKYQNDVRANVGNGIHPKLVRESVLNPDSTFDISSEHSYCKLDQLLNQERIYDTQQSVDIGCINYLNTDNNDISIIEGSFEDSLYANFKTSKASNQHQLRKSISPKTGCKYVSQQNITNKGVNIKYPSIVSSNIQNSVIDLTESLDNDNPSGLNSSEKNNSNIIESSLSESSQKNQDKFKAPMAHKKVPNKTLVLKPGKLWRRSLLMYRRSNLLTGIIKEENCTLNTGQQYSCKKCDISSLDTFRRSSIKIIPAETATDKTTRRTSLLEEYALNAGYEPDQIYQENLENSFRSLSLIEEKSHILDVPPPITARDVVLRKCGQVEPIPFQECYPESLLRNCHKIGEGVYGEVFLLRNPNGGTSVIKIIPIEGNLIVNGERQKKFDEIVSEIIIATELSNLRLKKSNSTNAFNEVQQVNCVLGSYPRRLLDLWGLFEETQGSDNDCPEVFPSDQLFIILQLANGGKDLESFLFNNAMQAYAMFQQVALALAVAETELGFEHRDLHWGNVLLTTVDKNKSVTYKLNGMTYEISTKGVEAAIIDFTLSRIENDGVVIFNDLAMDEELFTGDGDYQFEIYKSMKKKNRNNWETFEPYTNLLWLHYVLEKAISALRYKYTQTKIHKEYTAKMKHLYNEILNYKSAKDFVLSYLVAQ